VGRGGEGRVERRSCTRPSSLWSRKTELAQDFGVRQARRRVGQRLIDRCAFFLGHRFVVRRRVVEDAREGVEQVQRFGELFLAGAERDQLAAILDACVAVYRARLDEDQQVDFKGKAKVFCRTYDFLASVLPNTHPAWERL